MEHYRGLGHIAVYAEKLEESIAFYQRIGGKLLNRCDLPDRSLALVELGGVVLELLQFPDSVIGREGCISHFAIAVDDVDAAAKALEQAGVDTFETPETVRMPDLFGGLDNRFFKGPSGERIELLKMYH